VIPLKVQTSADRKLHAQAYEQAMTRRKWARRSGAYMGVTRKRDLRIVKHPVFGPEARLKFGPRSSNPKTRKVAKRRARHYAKHGMVFLKDMNRDS